MTTQIVGKSKAFAGGTVGNQLAITIWRGEPNLADLAKQQNAIAKVVQKSPKNCAFICCIEPSSPKPSSEVQAKITEAFQSFGADLAAVAYIVEGSALRSAAVRSIMTGMTVLKGAPQPMKFFGDLKSGEAWVRNLIRMPDYVLLDQAVDEVRKNIEA